VDDSKLINFNDKRKELIEEKRRNFERVIFENFLGAYTVLDKNGVIYPIKLIDISQEGCMIRLPWGQKDQAMEVGQELTLRFYFTKDSFVPAVCSVRYSREFIDRDGKDYLNYGLEFDRTMASYAAIKAFVDFLVKFAELSAHDRGDAKVYSL